MCARENFLIPFQNSQLFAKLYVNDNEMTMTMTMKIFYLT